MLFIAFFAISSTAILPLAGCSHARQTEREREEHAGDRDEERDRENHEREEEEEEEARENAPPAKPMEWGGGITAEPIESPAAAAQFHIGSPLFLRLTLSGNHACEPFNGQPFFFDASGAQLGWGFEEVADSLIFPTPPGTCQRIVMLSSENSNRLAEGSYTFKTLIFLDAASRLYSDTIPVRAVRADGGADTLSYTRFLQELIVKNSTMLNDPETIRALFADGTPRSAESEVYRAAILLRAGDPTGAQSALVSARQHADRRHVPLDRSATAAYGAIERAIARGSAR